MKYLVLVFVCLLGCNAFGQEPRLVLPIGHTSSINSAEISSNGKRIVTASADKTAKIWDLQTGMLLADLKETSSIDKAFFSTDNRRIITIAKNVRLWDMNGICLATLKDTADVRDAFFSPDSKKIITVSNNVKIWNAGTGKFLKRLKMKGSGQLHALYLPGGRIITWLNKTVGLWNVETGMLKDSIRIDTAKNANLSMSADHKVIYSSSQYSIRLWDLERSKVINTLKIDSTDLSNIIISPDDQKIIIRPDGNIAKILNPKNGKLLFSIKVDEQNITQASFSADGKEIITISQDHKTRVWAGAYTRIWDANTGALLAELESNGNGFDVDAFDLSPDNKLIVTVSDGLNLSDAKTGETLSFLNKKNDFSQTPNFTSSGKAIISSIDNDEDLWDSKTGSLIKKFGGHTSPSSDACFSSDGTQILMTNKTHSAMLWDKTTCKLIHVFKEHAELVYTACFSPDNKKILTTANDSKVRIWDTRTGQLLTYFEIPTVEDMTAFFSPNGKTIVTSNSTEKFMIWDAENANLLKTITYESPIRYAAYMPDNKRLVTGSREEFTRIWDAQNGTLLSNFNTVEKRKQLIEKVDYHIDTTKFKDPPRAKHIPFEFATTPDYGWNPETEESNNPHLGLHKVVFSPDAQNMITIISGHTKIWDVNTDSLIFDFKDKDIGYYSFWPDSYYSFSADSKKLLQSGFSGTSLLKIQSGKWIKTSIQDSSATIASFSPDGHKIAMGAANGTVSIWDAEIQKCLLTLQGHPGGINNLCFSPDQKELLTTSDDNTCKTWDLSNGKLISTFFAVDSADYFNQIPSGYYLCSPNAAKLLHYVTKNLEVITFDQLDIKYNRPDKVLQAIGCPDTALIRSYRKAYEKRIKKLGIDTTQFKSGYSVPKSDFKNRYKIQYEQKQDKLQLAITGIDRTYTLDRFNVWVNDVPVYGVNGVSLKKRKNHYIDTAVTISLSSGQNRIETSVINTNGAESYHMPLYVNYQAPDTGKLHFIGIGIDKFADSQYNLQWSAKDIRDLAIKFKARYPGAEIDTLFNADVTLKNVTALKTNLLQTNVDDKVIIAYSGHGLLSDDYDYYLSSYDIDFNKPEHNGIPYDALENLLDGIPARKKLMLIDACNSGEVDKEELAKYVQAAPQLAANGVKTDMESKGVRMKVDPNKKVGMKNSFELMQDLFVNVGKSTGATIISAAGGTQFAQEKGDLKNGVFTYSILEYFNQQPHCTISALKTYVNKRVTELTAGMQVPTARSENDAVDWEVW